MRQMRKSKRERDAVWAFEVFDKAPFVTVGMIRPDNTPYALPLSLVRKDDKVFYFHCAREGEKIDCISANPMVSLCAVSKCTPKFEEEKCNYTEYYHSAVAIGICSEVKTDDEKMLALRLLCERFLPKHMEHFEAAISRSLSITSVYKITLTEPPVGKCKP